MPVTLQHQTLKQKTMKFKSIILSSLLLTSLGAFAQEENTVETLNQRVSLLEDGQKVASKLKVSGYIQAQWQTSQIDSAGKASQDMKVGEGKHATEIDNMNRFGVRRGRLKVAYEDKDLGLNGVVQLDMTEKGVGLKDAYMQILDPWTGWVSFKGGIFDRPFGYEISYSSSRRESPERSRVFQTLFPDERDLGAMFILQGPKTSPWNVLKLEAGLFGGNGIAKDNDSKKDFIGHLSYANGSSNINYGLGVSLYSGYVAQLTKYVYKMNGDAFAVDSASTNKNSFANRNYLGFDGQFSIASAAGLTSIRGEYLVGKQPGSSSKSNSPSSSNVNASDTYIRNFQGGYVQLVQDIADTKHSLTLKYDWYDPNTKVEGVRIGVAKKTSIADMSYSTFGFGYLYRMNSNVRIMAYYDIVKNEKTSVKGYKADLKDNLFTLRFQYKF